MEPGQWVTVYRGYEPSGLDLVESMLRAEGFSPRRLGNANPALLGVGSSAVEQLIEVPREHERAARALIGSAQQPLPAQDQLAELESQAMDSSHMPVDAHQPTENGGFAIRIAVLLLAIAVVAFFVLK